MVPRLATHTDCTGCSSCANACAHYAIEMRADAEGFLQPFIDAEKCVECGLCVKKCPVLNPLEIKLNKQIAYAVINYEDRTVSSSGGAFSMFARYVLNKGGAVYGSMIDENLQVYHTRITSEEDLSKLRGSKYVQSKVGNTFQEAKNDLMNGLTILYSGTPCQVAGLYAFLGKRYEGQLLTLDLVCHGIPNQLVFDNYIEKIKKSTRLKSGNGNVEGFRFRKLDSWDYRPAVKFSETKWQMLSQEDNAYMSAFFKGLLYRESCFRCQYAKIERVGTFTIADFWGVGRYGKAFKKNVASGVSLVLDNYGQMQQILNNISGNVYVEKRTIEEARAENDNLNFPIKRPQQRDNAMMDFLDRSTDLKTFCKKYNLLENKDWKFYMKNWLKNLIYFFGLYNVYKTVSYKLGK